MDNRKKSSNQYKKHYIHKRDGGICFYCEIDLPLEKGTVDHVIPKSKGGADSRYNLVWCCRSCNEKKDDDYPQFRVFLLTVYYKLLQDMKVSICREIHVKKQEEDTEKYRRALNDARKFIDYLLAYVPGTDRI